MGEHNENCLVNTNLKSIDSICRSYVRFWNRTQRKVDVIWMNYEGNRVKYKTLHPYKFVDVNTFVTHPWIFWDSNTHDQMVVHGQKVFQPKPWDQDIPPNLPRQPFRRNIFITLPVYSLQECCFQVICKYFKTKEDISSLNIPASIISELVEYIDKK